MNDFFKNNDFTKAFQNFPGFQAFQNPQAFKTPAVDMNKFFTLQRKNIEAFSAATQALSEGTQAIARRGAEFVRDHVEEALTTSREVMAAGSAPDKAMEKQGEFAKNLFENAVDQLREVTEMATKTQFEAFDILSSRFSRSVEEVKDIAGKAAATATKKAA
jgi:phasin family protein